MAELVNLDGKRVLVVGGATGMGAAAAREAVDRGAVTIVADVAPIAYPCSESMIVDLSNRKSVDSLIAAVDAPVDAVLACAGVADGTPNVVAINFVSQRYLVEGLLAEGKLANGSAIGFISSVAGLTWMSHLEHVKDFLAQDGWDSAMAWIAAHDGSDTYTFSKEAINAYVASSALSLRQAGVRINGVMPGPTDTPLARANADRWLGFGADFREAAGVDPLTPEQVANPLLFLCSEASSGINGSMVMIDHGHVSSSLVDAFDAPFIKAMAGLT